VASNVINDLILKSVRGIGATAFTITHDIGSAMKIASRVAMLHEGKIVWQGPPAALRKPGTKIVADFVAGVSLCAGTDIPTPT
jgi:phospholipid/cholesterol/gamma-HCH transport system ATP-binding protein